DRKTIVSAIYGKFGVPTSAFRWIDAWDPKSQNAYPYNPQKAKALLAAAGYPNGFKISIGFLATDPPAQGLVPAGAKYLDAIGVQIVSNSAPTIGAFVSDIYGNKDELYIIGLPYDYSLASWWQGEISGKSTGWNDKIMDSNWLKGERATNPAPYYAAMVRRL